MAQQVQFSHGLSHNVSLFVWCFCNLFPITLRRQCTNPLFSWLTLCSYACWMPKTYFSWLWNLLLIRGRGYWCLNGVLKHAFLSMKFTFTQWQGIEMSHLRLSLTRVSLEFQIDSLKLWRVWIFQLGIFFSFLPEGHYILL